MGLWSDSLVIISLSLKNAIIFFLKKPFLRKTLILIFLDQPPLYILDRYILPLHNFGPNASINYQRFLFGFCKCEVLSSRTVTELYS